MRSWDIGYFQSLNSPVFGLRLDDFIDKIVDKTFITYITITQT